MKVLAYLHGYLPYLPAGSETMVHEMLLALRAGGAEVTVVTTMHHGKATDWEVDGIACHQREQYAADLLTAAWAPDVIVSHHENAVHAIGLARHLGAASVSLVHNDFSTSHSILRAGPDLVVCNTRWLSARLNPARAGARSIVVHPPVDPERHRTEPGDMVTMVNMFKPMKNPNMFWSLAGKCPDIKFLAVTGAYGPQDIRPGYSNVEVIPTTSDMRGDVWSRTRVILVPSRYESYGKGPVEAAASGIPALAAPTPGLREALGNGATFIPRTDGPSWHRRLRALVDDSEAWATASAAALARSAEIEAARPLEMAALVDALRSLVPLPA